MDLSIPAGAIESRLSVLLAPRTCTHLSIPAGAIESGRLSEAYLVEYKLSIPAGAIESCSFYPGPRCLPRLSIPAGAIESCTTSSRSATWTPLSIPAGAIESSLREAPRSFSILSIPAGAIESKEHRGGLGTVACFQYQQVRWSLDFMALCSKHHFHFQYQQVRLSRPCRWRILISTGLSIPAGAIESGIERQMLRLLEVSFQYQQVRLSLYGAVPTLTKGPAFNTSRCD